MQLNTLDTIVKRWLLENGLPIHYYAEGLYSASAALRELSFDTLQIVNTRSLPLNAQNAVDFPADFVDDVMVGIPVGDRMQPVPKLNSLNPLRVANESGTYGNYTETTTNENGSGISSLPYAIWYWNFNEYGEPTGRFFGVGGGSKLNGYKVVWERRQIQFTDVFSNRTIVLMYISDGQSLDAATQIDTMAFAAIQAYIAWKRSPNRNADFSPEGQHFYNQRRLLRARKNDLTPIDIKEILRKNVRASIKG
jgi:hypothetical protein